VSSNSDVDHCVIIEVARFSLQHTVGTRITVPEISFNAENFSSISCQVKVQYTLRDVLDDVELEVSSRCLTGCFIHRIRGWVGPRAGLDMVLKRKISTCHELSPEFLTFQLIAQ
jgi:hypothetical protein